MDRPPVRRLNLIDIAVLIASTSIGFWILRAAHESRSQLPIGLGGRPIWVWSWGIGLEASPFLLTMSAGLLVARSLKPRPSHRELFRQPGLIASLAILVGTALGVVIRVGHIWIAGLHGFGLNYSLDSYLAIVMGTGELVAVSWSTLALAGAWRPEPSWVDRAGRLLGVFIILLWVASGLNL